MASARKKQDEKNLKILRELVSQPHNKYCFDCNQRGPTYVNVTIGSFVCTKCSGILRGLTPPHRVKSISMATFTQEEIELVQQRGNDYCRRTWLGLYEGRPLNEGGGGARDDDRVHEMMVDKYERRKYYLEPTTAAALAGGGGGGINGQQQQQQQQQQPQQNGQRVKPLTSIVADPKPIRLNGSNATSSNLRHQQNGAVVSRPSPLNNISNNNSKVEFVVNFEQADIFNAANNNSFNGASSTQINTGSQLQASFANFENNPIFSNTSSMPDLNNTMNNAQKNNSSVPPAPPEDRYLPLKDLDNALKNQTTIDWNLGGGSNPNGSNNGGGSSSGYSSSTPSGSMYSSSSPQSMYGSPSQGQFSTIFPTQETTISNPFNAASQNGVWGTTNGFTNGASPNPFQHQQDPFKVNGVTPNFQANFNQFNGQTWTPNPFKVATNGYSNNPFL